MADHQREHAEQQQAALRELAEANLNLTEKLATLTGKIEASIKPGNAS